MKSATIIKRMKEIFSRLGIPQRVISDNLGPVVQNNDIVSYRFVKISNVHI